MPGTQSEDPLDLSGKTAHFYEGDASGDASPTAKDPAMSESRTGDDENPADDAFANESINPLAMVPVGEPREGDSDFIGPVRPGTSTTAGMCYTRLPFPCPSLSYAFHLVSPSPLPDAGATSASSKDKYATELALLLDMGFVDEVSVFPLLSYSSHPP